ncbi:hypothetical protein [Glycomyces terrestris]|uniref:Uncharacterized protein n=1 Tax=Glycomyces terrestris TaxID=2493553 RepID=A0A426V3T0_9ACTN|nr:hypothetical protein [Glycomyces terrestris]RRS01569.1 hypothetical protein EIW28_02030 [Glycomyces terrestris]
MKVFFLGWTRFVVVLLVLQIGFAGWGAVTSGDERVMRFIVHAGNGGMLMLWLMLSVVFALIARPGYKAVLLCVLSLFMIFMQGALAYGFGTEGVRGGIGIALHATNGLGILTVQLVVARLAKRAVEARRAQRAAQRNEVMA